MRLPGSVDEAFLMIDQSLPAGDRERWAHPNRLGSTIVISDSTGAVIDTHTYAPFGQAGEGDGGFPFRFTGQKLDPETGLYYYKARYYDPELGRFLQTDPIGYADQMNLYAYVANDPINATDPTGEVAFIAACAVNPACRGAVAFGIGAAIGTSINAVSQYNSTGEVNWGDALSAGAAAGTVSAAVAINPALATNTAALSAIGGVSGVSGSVAGDLINQRDINVSNAIVAGVAGAVAAPGGAYLGNVAETALGASASSIVGEVGGAALGEGIASSINAAAPGVANLARQAGSSIVNGVELAGRAI